MNNIYQLFRDYNKLNQQQQKMFLMRLDHDIRESLKNFIQFSNKQDRFYNIYDGWIENIEDELVILEVYSVILQTINTLNSICINDEAYGDYLKAKKSMLYLLLSNKQYNNASKLFSINMYDEAFRKRKMDELAMKVSDYLIAKKLPLSNKLIEQIYAWVDERRLPSYMVSKMAGEFKFDIIDDNLQPMALQKDVELALQKPTAKLEKIVDSLIEKGKA